MRPFYSDYVRHSMRFYSRNLHRTTFTSKTDELNWWSCQTAMSYYNDTNKNILISVYSGYDTITDNVYQTAKTYNVNQNVIWDMLKEFERRVASERGLL